MTEIVVALATLVLGVTVGALLAEGAVLVPFWRGLEPKAFLGWYRLHADVLLRFYGSLEVAAVALALAALGAGWIEESAALPWLVTSALCAVAVLAVFPLYFRKANASFASGSIASGAVARELARWSRWHSARTVLAAASCAAAMIALLRG